MPALATVILTRETDDNRELLDRLTARGITVIDYPCIRTRLFPFRIGDLENGSLEDVDVVIFTSKRAVRAVAGAAKDILMSHSLIGSVGPATTDHIRRIIGREPDIEPEINTGEALAKAVCREFTRSSVSGSGTAGVEFRAIYFRGDKTNPRFREIIENGGGRLTQIEVYATERPQMKSLELRAPAVAVFASPSAANHFFDVNPALVTVIHAVAIGPVTAWRLREQGVSVVAEAPEPSTDALFRVITDYCCRKGEKL